MSSKIMPESRNFKQACLGLHAVYSLSTLLPLQMLLLLDAQVGRLSGIVLASSSPSSHFARKKI